MMEVAGEVTVLMSMGGTHPQASALTCPGSCCLSATLLPGVRAQGDHLHGACQGPSTQTPPLLCSGLLCGSAGPELGSPALHS